MTCRNGIKKPLRKKVECWNAFFIIVCMQVPQHSYEEQCTVLDHIRTPWCMYVDVLREKFVQEYL